MAVHESLAQRLVIRHHLTGLAHDEIDAYVRHRLVLTGAPDIPIFDANAIEAMFQSAQGLPRRVNQIAHLAMVAAAAAKECQITMDHVATAADELRLST